MKDTKRKLTEPGLTVAHRDWNQQPGSLRGTDLGTLHMCDSCIAWFFGGTPHSGNRDCLRLFY